MGFNCLQDSVQDGLGAQCVRQLPAHDLPAVPVDDRGQVHVAVVQLHIGDVDRPCLVWKLCLKVPKQIGHDGFLEVPLRQVRFGIVSPAQIMRQKKQAEINQTLIIKAITLS